MNTKYMVVIAVVAVMLVASTALATEDAFAGKKKYEKSQAVSQVNDCGNGFIPTNIGCQNTASQIQGDENVVTLTADQIFPEVDGLVPAVAE
jgi:hypothetical protein